jgi:hypothetical protein
MFSLSWIVPQYKTLACLAIGVLAVAAIALAAVEAGQLHEQVLVELERKLDEHFVGDFNARRLSGSLIWGFTAHDVQISNSGGAPVAHIDELQVDASAFALLDGQLRFDRARLVRPIVIIERYADGSTQTDDVFDARRPGTSSRSKNSRPKHAHPKHSEVLFEMTRAEVVDGQFIYVDSQQPSPEAFPAHPAGQLGTGSPTNRANDDQVTSQRRYQAHQIHAEGSFQVLASNQTKTLIDRLDAKAAVVAGPDSIAKPRHIRLHRARIRTDANICTVGAGDLAIDDHWRVEDLFVSRPKGSAAHDAGPIKPIRLQGRASSPDGGSLDVDGYVDRRDDSYSMELDARNFRPADWPAGPQWPWLVLDGNGAVSGHGWTPEELDATIRWSEEDLALGDWQPGQQTDPTIDDLDIIAHIADRQIEVETLDISTDGFTASARGHLSESGDFSVDMDSHFGGAFAKQLAAETGHYKVGAQLRDAAAFDVSITASGGLDFSGRDAAHLLEHVDLDTTWKARDVSVDDMHWDVAGGALKVQVPGASPAQRTTRRFSYQTSAALHDLHQGPFGADILHATVSGEGAWEANQGLAGLSYKLNVGGDRLTLGEHQTERARLEVSGALSPAAKDAKWPLKGLAADGTLDLLKYRTDKISARRIATNIDVSGAFPIGQGTIQTHATGLRIDDRRFRHAQTTLKLLDDQTFRLRSKARVEISIIPDLPMYLDIIGRHGRDLKALSLDKLEIGRPGMRWRIRKPGLVLFKEGAVELKSLTLQRRSQRVRLDGEYGRGKKGSVSAIASRLTSAQLRSFFDFGALF